MKFKVYAIEVKGLERPIVLNTSTESRPIAMAAVDQLRKQTRRSLFVILAEGEKLSAFEGQEGT
jgi:hypothetical protein